MSEEKKPKIDERLEALATSLELLSVNVHALQDQSRKFEEWREQADVRERRGRQAIMAGIAAYIKTLENGEGPV